MYDRDDAAPSLLSFLIGGIVGASVTCLLATRTGLAFRRRLRERFNAGAEALTVRGHTVPEPGLPTDMGRGERG